MSRAMALSETRLPEASGKFLAKKTVPRIGLGMAALGRPGYINLGHSQDLSARLGVSEMREGAYEVLDAAWDLGVRYFDAARSYGKSEEFLGGWLRERGHSSDDVLLGSKWGYYYNADWQVETSGAPHEIKEHTYANLVKQTAESEALVGSHVDLYQIHSATRESGVLQAADVLGELARLKADKGWRIGLTLSGVQQGALLQEAMQLKCPDGTPLFDCVQATWNLLEQSVGPSLLVAHEAGMHVIVKEAMANGRLTDRNANPAFAPKLAKLQAAADKLDTTVDALALACALAQPFDAMVLSGAACVDHLRSNFAATEVLARLDAATVNELMDACSSDPEEYWAERSALAWN